MLTTPLGVDPGTRATAVEADPDVKAARKFYLEVRPSFHRRVIFCKDYTLIAIPLHYCSSAKSSSPVTRPSARLTASVTTPTSRLSTTPRTNSRTHVIVLAGASTRTRSSSNSRLRSPRSSRRRPPPSAPSLRSCRALMKRMSTAKTTLAKTTLMVKTTNSMLSS